MSYLLHIDTAIHGASVCLSEDETVVSVLLNLLERDSAAWLHVAIQQILSENNLPINQLAAIALSAGPGSYTGLRVGMAAAKGICYALSIPLITINTLQMMAAAVQNATADLLCPMIDARRMEVFTALFNKELEEVSPPTNQVLEAGAYGDLLETSSIAFFGNGSKKAADVIKHPQATFLNVEASAKDLVPLAVKKFLSKDFANLAYSEPFYGKDFHSSTHTKFY